MRRVIWYFEIQKIKFSEHEWTCFPLLLVMHNHRPIKMSPVSIVQVRTYGRTSVSLFVSSYLILSECVLIGLQGDGICSFISCHVTGLNYSQVNLCVWSIRPASRQRIEVRNIELVYLKTIWWVLDMCFFLKLGFITNVKYRRS